MAEDISLDRVERAEEEAKSAEDAANRKATACEGKKAAVSVLHEQIAARLADVPEAQWLHATEAAIAACEKRTGEYTEALTRTKAAYARAEALTKDLPKAEKKLQAAQDLRQQRELEGQTARQRLAQAQEETQKAASGLMPEGWNEDMLSERRSANLRDCEAQSQRLRQAERDQQRLHAIAQPRGRSALPRHEFHPVPALR